MSFASERETWRAVVISWNLTRRCNLVCEHCYIDAKHAPAAGHAAPPDSAEAVGALPGELSTRECLRVADQIAETFPEAMLILTGGEPLLRRDIFEIASHASAAGLWVVVGTNGVRVTEKLARAMGEAGIRGVSLSLDSTDERKHDGFRGVKGAWKNTVEGSAKLRNEGLPFIVQTTLSKINREEISDIARMAHDLGAKVWNVYFLVPTGRGAFISNLEPGEYEEILNALIPLQKAWAGKMLINSKCAPHYQRVLYETDPSSPFLKAFAGGAGGCPAGTQYLGISPRGEMTPCPYLPVYGGNLRETPMREIWEASEVFVKIRRRGSLGGRCGPCEFNAACGGCRARAFGSTGDYMAEDPWCVYEPGRYGGRPVSWEGKTTYGGRGEPEMAWSAAARERIRRVPAFVRGMVVRSVEKYARERGYAEVDEKMMEEVRARILPRIGRMPSLDRKDPAPAGGLRRPES